MKLQNKKSKWAFDNSRLRACRELQGLSPEQLGKLLGKSGVSITNWEQGKTFPRITDLTALANAFDIDPRVFLRKEDGSQTRSIRLSEKLTH